MHHDYCPSCSESRLGTEGRFKGVGEPGRGPAGVPGAVETVGLAGWGAKAQETDQADKPGSGEGPRLPATPTAVQEQLQPLFR